MVRKSDTKAQSRSMMPQTLRGRLVFRLSLLAMMGISPILFPSSMISSELADLEVTQRRLSTESSSDDATPEEKNRSEAVSEQMWKYEKECLPLIKGGVDIINATEADNCSKVCGDVVAADVILNSFIATWHSRLLHWIPASPSMGTFYLYCGSVCIAILGTCAYFVFFILQDICGAGDPSEACTFLIMVPVGLMAVQFCIMHFWVSGVIGLCLSAAAWTSNPAGATASVPWAYPIIQFFFQLKLAIPHVPLLLSVLVILSLAMWVLVRALSVSWVYYQQIFETAEEVDNEGDEGGDEGEKRATKKFDWHELHGFLLYLGGCWMAVLLIATACAWIPEAVIIPLSLLYSSGSHGPVWICSKTQAATFMRWLPRTGAYGAGFSYAMAAVLHGLLLDYKRASQQKFHGPSRDQNKYGVSDATSASSWLYLKFAGIFLDISFDFAQIVLFLMLGEPFFALYNLAGILLQIFLFIVSMVRGSIPEASFFTIVLQSDAIVHFRSSVDIGFPVFELYEKVYREAFGETYISMSVAICAVFTVPVQQVTDAIIFIFSVMLSLSAVRTGVAEAFEYSSAEQISAWTDTGERALHARLIPINHYYRRRDFGNKRMLGWISTMRICEALVPVNALAIGCASASVKTTFLVAAGLAFSTLLLPIMLELGADVIEKKGCIGSLRELWDEFPGTPRCSRFEDFIDDLLDLLGAAAFLFAAACILLAAFALSPLLYIILYPYSIANPGKYYEWFKGSPLNFRNFILSKSLFAFVFWCIMLLGFIDPHLSPFELHKFMWDSLKAIRSMKEAVFKEIVEAESHPWELWSNLELVQSLLGNEEHTAGMLALVRLGLAGSSLIGMVFLMLTTYMLHDCQGNWFSEDKTNANQLLQDCTHLSAAIDLISMRFKFMAEARFGTDKGAGVRDNADDNFLAQIMMARLVDYIYGPADRADRVTDDTADGFNVVEETLRTACELEVTGKSLSPEDLAEDIRNMMRQFERSRRPPHVIALCGKLEECAKWLDGLCVFRFVDRQQHSGDSSESWLGWVCRCFGVRQAQREELGFELLDRNPETDADMSIMDEQFCARHTIGSQRVADKLVKDIDKLVNEALKEEANHALLIVEPLVNDVPRETLEGILQALFCSNPEFIFSLLKSPSPELPSRILLALQAQRAVENQYNWRAQQLDEIITAIAWEGPGQRKFMLELLVNALLLHPVNQGAVSPAAIIQAGLKGNFFGTEYDKKEVANILDQVRAQRDLAKEDPPRVQLLDEITQMLSGMLVMSPKDVEDLHLHEVNPRAVSPTAIIEAGFRGNLLGDEDDKEEVVNILDQLKAQRDIAKQDPARVQLLDAIIQMLSGMFVLTYKEFGELNLHRVNERALRHESIIQAGFKGILSGDRDDKEEVFNILEQLKTRRELATEDPSMFQLCGQLLQILTDMEIIDSN